MYSVRDDLVRWNDRYRDMEESYDTTGTGFAREGGRRGLVADMRRDVEMIALTPSKQEMRSSVGREVRSYLECLFDGGLRL